MYEYAEHHCNFSCLIVMAGYCVHSVLTCVYKVVLNKLARPGMDRLVMCRDVHSMNENEPNMYIVMQENGAKYA